MTAHATPGHPVVRGPFSFVYNTAGLANGVTFYIPTIGDLLINFIVTITTPWNGNFATNNFDFGPFINTTRGLFHLTNVNAGGFPLADLPTNYDTLANSSSGIAEYGFMLPITTADPWKIVVSQDGMKGGPSVVDATQGAGRLYIVTATPTPF